MNIEKERAAFEEWTTQGNLNCPSIERSKTNPEGYKLMQTQSDWQAWQARAAQPVDVPTKFTGHQLPLDEYERGWNECIDAILSKGDK